MAEPPESARYKAQPIEEFPNALNYEAITAELKQRPHNPSGWKRLIHLAEESGDKDRVRASFDALLQQYPNTSSAQIRYIGHFLQEPSTFGEAEDLFRKFLVKSSEVELWKFYLTYVRRVNTSSTTRDAVRKSYEFAVNHIGQDQDSGDIWRDYIQFIRCEDTTTIWEEQQKMDALRKVYHRVVQIPLEGVEGLWQELESFENNLNRTTAKKFMTDLSPAHMQACTTFRQLKNHAAALFPRSTIAPLNRPELVLPALPTFDTSERTLVGKWKAYLKWEESNPLNLGEKDKSILVSRIQSVYRKALIRMQYYTEIWFMAYTWLNSVGRHDEALSILQTGIEANPGSYLLTFTYAEALEVRQAFSEVRSQFDRLLDVLRMKLENLDARIGAEEAKNSNNPLLPATQRKLSELAERQREYGLAYTTYMRFGRRAEGIQSSRAIFRRARKDKWTPWEVYEAAALMEYHCSEDGRGVGSRIFEKGLELFANEIEYALRYLGFLISINDEPSESRILLTFLTSFFDPAVSTDARALFERVIVTFTPDRARPLWELWARFIYQYGNLDSALKLEKRIAEVYSSDPPIKRFAQRHTYLGTDPIAAQDLGFALASKSLQTLGRIQTSTSITSTSKTIGSLSGGSVGGCSNKISSHKRPAPLDYYHTQREERGAGKSRDYSKSHKRVRGISPRNKRDRDKWDPAPPRWRLSPPLTKWEREVRDWAPLPPLGEEEKPKVPSLPGMISWFIGELPAPELFDGKYIHCPVFRTEDLINLLKYAVLSSSGRSKSPPPPTPGARPPPDYGLYQAPGDGHMGRRY